MSEVRCEKVFHDSPADIERLAMSLIANYNGKMPKGKARAIAVVMAMSHDGEILGFWGQINWKHENGQFESGDVVYEIV